ncbi:MAG: PilZ domain-containing protein [Deltaproteobacteria bacterium]|nr:PilZ domain-containing protein [Deltaproteobacteria bacterium]
MEDRRHSPRIPLDAPCLLTLLVNYEEERPAMAVDVSRGGVQLALSAGSGFSELTPGVPVTLKNVPAPLDRLLEGVHGKIAWVGLRCCGVKLNKDLPIAPADITDLARL